MKRFDAGLALGQSVQERKPKSHSCKLAPSKQIETPAPTSQLEKFDFINSAFLNDTFLRNVHPEKFVY